MYIMYVDESGDVGMVRSPTKYFVLCGLVIHELKWQDYLNELVAFRRLIKVDFGLNQREEIHASAMINKPGKLAAIPKHQRLEILRRVADLLAAMTDFSVISVVVDKSGKNASYDVFENAWRTLIQRFENTISSGKFNGPRGTADRGMLFPDHTDDKKLVKLLRRMRTFNPIPNQSSFGAGTRNMRIRTVIEDANFRHSIDSYFIQCVDVIAYLLYQRFNPSSYIKQKSGQNYFNRLNPILCRVASRQDPQGIVRL